MTSVAEIYFYSDPKFKGDTAGIISSLKSEGHRIVVGEDLEELVLLLPLAEPTAIVYTFSDERALVAQSFRSLKKEALKKSTPILVMGPGPDCTQFTLYRPRETRFTTIDIAMDRLGGVVDGLVHKLDELILPGHSRVDKPGKISPGEISPGKMSQTDRLFDVLGEGSEKTQIETNCRIAETTRLETTVKKAGEVLVMEEQTVENDDPDLYQKMRVQHDSAIQAYTPVAAPRSETANTDYPKEVSGPFASSNTEPRTDAVPSISPKRSRTLQIWMAIGALGCLCAVLYLATRTGSSLIDGEIKMESEAQPSDPIEPLKTVETKTVESPKPSGMAIPVDIDEDTAIPFPATFRPEKTLFLFLDDWEETRFLNMIKTVSAEKIIHVKGHASVEEAKMNMENLGIRRAWAVFRYFVRNGIAPERLRAFSGKPLLDALERDHLGRIRRRFVEIYLRKPRVNKEGSPSYNRSK